MWLRDNGSRRVEWHPCAAPLRLPFPGFLLAGGDCTDGDPVGPPPRGVRRGGVTSPALRRAAATGECLVEPWPCPTPVRDASHRTSDVDITRLTDAGHREGEMFELTVAAAAGVVLCGFGAGSRVLDAV